MNAYSTKPDTDLREAVEHAVVHYPPLVTDRHHFHIDIHDGEVTLSGHVLAPATRDYLVQTLSHIDGVSGIHAEQLYSDEKIRLAIGAEIPMGVIANVEYGVVILSGALPHGTTVEALTQKIGQIPGVARVVAAFRG